MKNIPIMISLLNILKKILIYGENPRKFTLTPEQYKYLMETL